METKKIILGTKEFDVPEMPIGRRKFIVPAMRQFFANGGADIFREEASYDLIIEIIFRAIFPQVKKVDLLMTVMSEKDLFAALTIISEQCGMKRVETKEGEDQGEIIPSPTTTP